MRKFLDILSVVAVLSTWALAIFEWSQRRFPAPAGENPLEFWHTAISASLLFFSFVIIRRYGVPRAYAQRPAGLRDRMRATAVSMLTWIMAELACFFLCVQVQPLLQQGGNRLLVIVAPLIIAAVWGTILWHVIAFRRSVKKSAVYRRV